jgi:NADH-quinone oxidoreductase subunit E
MTEVQVVDLSIQVKREINSWLRKFPESAKQSAIIPTLTIVQQGYGGTLTAELITAVANYLEVAETLVYEVATFYKMYTLNKPAKHKIYVCTNISCMLCKAYDLANHVKNKLGIEFGQVTGDGKFLLQEVECLGACDGAPAMMIDGKCYSNLTVEKVDCILAKIKD